MIYAQIKNEVVCNKIIIDDETKASLFAEGFDYCIRIDNLTVVPDIDWFYRNEQFTKVINFSIEGGISSEVPHGTYDSFESFKMSDNSGKFEVSVDGDNIIIGCQIYNYRWLRYAYWTLKTKDAKTFGPLVKRTDGLMYKRQFKIAQVDADAVYTALCTLKE